MSIICAQWHNSSNSILTKGNYMQFFKIGLATALTFATLSVPSVADEAAIKARQGLMRIYAQNLGILGAMAKGNTEYSAEVASAAAARLLSAASFDQSVMWPQGSDNVAMAGKTAAKPEIWTTFPAVLDSSKALIEAAELMNASAGTDLASLQSAMGKVGGSCAGCHKPYREK
jgi:cytochrome c556